MEATDIMVKHKGYTAIQSGLNHHVMIFDADGRRVAHIQKTEPQSMDDLKADIDFLLSFPLSPEK